MEECHVHKHRNHVPIDVHHIWPKEYGGPTVPENLVSLCPNGHREVHEMLRLIQSGKGLVVWIKARRYGQKVRKLARLGYDRIQRNTL